MKCEQNCELDAELLVYDRGPGMFMILCGSHENEVARMEGEMELDEINLHYSTTQEITKFLNDIITEKDKLYHDLLKDFLEKKKQLELMQ